MSTIKKILLFLIISTFSSVSEALDTKAEQAILFDYETNTIIFEKNSEELMSPSSMSKIMTIYYVFNKIKNGTMDVKHMQVDDLCLRQNGDTAVITYRCETAYTDNKIMVDGTVRSTTVYIFRDNRWQLIAAHQSNLETY